LKTEGVADMQQYFEEKVQEINKTLKSHERINKVIVRDSDFVRSPAMKILRSKNGQK
jgi:hypothetical protein